MDETVIPIIVPQDVSDLVEYGKKLVVEQAVGFSLPRRLLSSAAIAVRTQEAAESFFLAHEPVVE